MPISTDFLPFAAGGGANVETQVQFSGSAHQINGFTAGVAVSAQLNKVWRQSSMMAAAIANYMTNVLNVAVPDNGDMDALCAQFWQALMGGGYFVDSGAVNAISIAAPAGLSFLAPFAGLAIRVYCNNTNTSSSVTINYTGHGTKFVKLSNLNIPLQPGDIADNAVNTFVYDGTYWQLQSPSPQAIKNLAAISTTVSFTAVGGFTWTVPSGVYLIQRLTVVGGGGGGGFGTSTKGTASGGNGATSGVKLGIKVTPGQVISGVIGAGGAGVHNPANKAIIHPGSAGGNTTVTVGANTYTARGGLGGLSSINSTCNSNADEYRLPTTIVGGIPVIMFDVATAYPGGFGNIGISAYDNATNTGTPESGEGGDCVIGGIGGLGGGGIGGDGHPPGGGGGGSGNGQDSGDGASGAVYIEY